MTYLLRFYSGYNRFYPNGALQDVFIVSRLPLGKIDSSFSIVVGLQTAIKLQKFIVRIANPVINQVIKCLITQAVMVISYSG